MANMIPRTPNDYDPASKEGLMFEELDKLSGDYYVFHSFKMVSVSQGTLNESEADFVIFHPEKGILCIEAKAGQVQLKDGEWLYGNGIPIKNGGPYRQAERKKWDIKNLFIDKRMEDTLSHCKLLHAVWFPSIQKSQLSQIKFPADADKNITLTADSFGNIQQEIDKIFDIEIKHKVITNLNNIEISNILKNILCPSFNLIPSMASELSIKKNLFNKLLKEQINILNFLEEQPTAIINGIAGTGKTMIANEKARRHASSGDKVLFLCFNKNLCEYLKQNNDNSNITYHTIDGFACSYCNTQKADFVFLKKKLEDDFYTNKFPYQHIIIDEGQDFGQDRIEECDIIELLETIILAKENPGTFYIFYDKNQLIQSARIPKFISDADCKLTLYKNCRNTKNIATTSMRPINIEPKLFSGAVIGESPEIFISEDKAKQIEYIDKSIKECLNKGYEDIVILTCDVEDDSVLDEYVQNNYYEKFNKKIFFTTCRKFKGLEADAMILIDVTKQTFDYNKKLIFYVGASRAKFNLFLVCNMSENDCKNIAESLNVNAKRPYKAFAAALNASLVQSVINIG